MTSYAIRRRTRILASALLASAGLLGAAAAAQPAVAAADGGGLLEPTPLILKDGRIAHVSIHLIPFDQGRGELGQATAGPLDELTRGVATDCFLTAQVIGHVDPNEVEGGNTLGAHRLARARADVVQGVLIDGGLPAKSIASVWDWQFLVREPRVTLWLFRLSEGEDCDGTPLRPGAAPAQAVAAAEPPAAAAPPEQQQQLLELPQLLASAPDGQQRTRVADAAAGAGPADAGAATPEPRGPAAEAAERPADALPVPTAETQAPAAAAPIAPAPSKPAPVPPPQDIRTTEAAPPPSAASAGGDAAEAAIGSQARAITPDQELLAVVTPRRDSPAAAGAGSGIAPPAAPARQVAQPAAPVQQQQPQPQQPQQPQQQQPQQQAMPPPPPAASSARAAEPPAAQRPAQPAQAAAAAGEAVAGPVQITFPVNSSYFGEDARRDLAALVRSIRGGQRYRVQLTASVGTGDVQGVSHEEAVRYNRWLAARRLERVQEWLQENAGAELQIEPTYREDPSRQVEVRVMPAG